MPHCNVSTESKGGPIPEAICFPDGSMIPPLGRTRYCFGAVVFTLNPTFTSEGFSKVSVAVTTSSSNGPRENTSIIKKEK